MLRWALAVSSETHAKPGLRNLESGPSGRFRSTVPATLPTCTWISSPQSAHRGQSPDFRVGFLALDPTVSFLGSPSSPSEPYRVPLAHLDQPAVSYNPDERFLTQPSPLPACQCYPIKAYALGGSGHCPFRGLTGSSQWVQVL